MADPTLQTFCCVENNDSREGANAIVQFRSGPYNIVCIVFAVLGIIGGIYQILPRVYAPGVNKQPSNSALRSRYIIVWLATADLLGSLAVLIRSLSWILSKSTEQATAQNFSIDTVFCAISSGFIQFFYTATCFWTLCYAVDVFKVVHDDKFLPRFYHMVSWIIPAFLTLLGMSILYTPNFDCHDMGTNAFVRILPNYLVTYVPIAIVMIANPILYWKSSRKAEDLVKSVSGIFTHNERKNLKTLRLKFLSINLVFYLCWLPNLINGFLLWSLWTDVPKNFLLFDWYLMAIFNPLQAMLNAFVYRKWGNDKSYVKIPWFDRFQRNPIAQPNYSNIDSDASNNERDSISDDSKNGYGSL